MSVMRNLELGETAYNAFCHAMPEGYVSQKFEELPEIVRKGWVAAALAAIQADRGGS
jgi:hypothetical protein